ncbi:hypothetical protein BDV12DRAFT_203135 [Aspergillus spectabilis]
MTLPTSTSVLVIGSGNAGLCSAISAAESGARNVLLIDACPENWAGGNSYFTAGAFRTVHRGLSDVLPLPYTAAHFSDDIARICIGRSDPDLSRTLVADSNVAVKWLASHGVRFQLSFNRQAYEIGGRFKFWGGMCLKTQEGGKGLVADERRAAEQLGVKVVFGTAAKRLVLDSATGAVRSVVVEDATGERGIQTGAVILAAGGFEATPRMRAQFLGPGWDFAKAGNWSGCHSVAWDANAPANSGDRVISNEFTKSGYPLGLMLNLEGDRFVDEGVDMRNYTYAIFGKAILGQPGHAAFQVWDANMTPWLRSEEYREEIFVSTIKQYNEAVAAFQVENPGHKWDPAVKDGLSTQSTRKQLTLAKSNWATPLTKGPYVAVKVTCGVTFTFGGLAVDHEPAGVISSATNSTIPGLYCAGEMLGGLFYDNYPGGSGLTSGAVFGRRAGRAAAAQARKQSIGARL